MIDEKFVKNALAFVRDVEVLRQDTTRDPEALVAMDFATAQLMAVEILALAMLADINFEERFEERAEDNVIDLFGGDRE